MVKPTEMGGPTTAGLAHNVLYASLVCVVVLFSATTVYVRDAGYGGPHHDEVIALLAAKGMEREYARMLPSGDAPLHRIVPASAWHDFTHEFTPIAFNEIRSDVLGHDKHPPLAFWVMNRWLSLFPNSNYQHAVVLVWLQILLAGGVLAFTVLRITRRSGWAVVALALFLAGNSAVFTASWVRQYALFVVLYAVVVLCAAELARRNLSNRSFVVWSAAIALASLLGMMSQYTFVTMSGPIHLAVLGVLAFRKRWSRVGILIAAYAAAGGLFFLFLPGALDHVSAVSGGLDRKWQLAAALGAVPRMYIPLPSSLPVWLTSAAGVAALLVPLIVAMFAIRTSRSSPDDSDPPDIRVPLAGMLGAGVLQFVLVAVGYFPGWATGENHLCAFWLLTVLAVTLLLSHLPRRFAGGIVTVALVAMLGMQGPYVWHLHRILPRVNTSYIASQEPDLILVDNLARGFVLQITDVVPPRTPVLATDSMHLANQLADGSLHGYAKILYLPMDTTVAQGKATVIAAAQGGGRRVTELPVVHTGMYEAVLFEAHAQRSDPAPTKRTVPRSFGQKNG